MYIYIYIYIYIGAFKVGVHVRKFRISSTHTPQQRHLRLKHAAQIRTNTHMYICIYLYIYIYVYIGALKVSLHMRKFGTGSTCTPRQRHFRRRHAAQIRRVPRSFTHFASVPTLYVFSFFLCICIFTQMPHKYIMYHDLLWGG